MLEDGVVESRRFLGFSEQRHGGQRHEGLVLRFIVIILEFLTRSFAISFEWRKGKASQLLIYDCFVEDVEKAAWLKNQNSEQWESLC